MAKNKFLTKVLIVFFVAAIFLAACSGQSQPTVVVGQLQPGDPEYVRIYDLGFANGKTSVVIDQTTCQGLINQTTCQTFVDAALGSVVYDALSCAAPISAAQTSWVSSRDVCEAAGFGYPAMTIDSALETVETNGYYCYIPVTIVPTATPKPKLKREEPSQPPCPPGGCATPPPECSGCATPPPD